MATRRRKFTPYRPPAPPAGSYDPSLDAQLAAARRGLGDLQNQIGTAQARDVTDYASAQQQATEGYRRNLGDLIQASSRGTEDYNRNVGLLTRRYGQLGEAQTQQANAAGVYGSGGVIRGGALLQSAARRAENQGIEQQGLDTAYQRSQADIGQQAQRLQEDSGTRLGQLALDYAPPDAGANPLGGRRYQDRTTQLTQAQRENAFFGQDVNAMKAFQASGSGWDPPQRPANEFVSKAGVPYQVRGGIRYDQFGRRLGRATGRGF